MSHGGCNDLSAVPSSIFRGVVGSSTLACTVTRLKPIQPWVSAKNRAHRRSHRRDCATLNQPPSRTRSKTLSGNRDSPERVQSRAAVSGSTLRPRENPKTSLPGTLLISGSTRQRVFGFSRGRSKLWFQKIFFGSNPLEHTLRPQTDLRLFMLGSAINFGATGGRDGLMINPCT